MYSKFSRNDISRVQVYFFQLFPWVFNAGIHGPRGREMLKFSIFGNDENVIRGMEEMMYD